MKTLFKNKLAIVMALVMLLSCFALFGCGEDTKDDTTATTTTAATDVTKDDADKDTASEDETPAVTTAVVDEKPVIGTTYKPYLARKDGKDVNLETVFGKGYAKYGDSITFNEDGTFTAYIGVTTGDDASTGTYKYNGKSEIVLSYNNDKTEVATVVTFDINENVQEFRILKGDVNVMFSRVD